MKNAITILILILTLLIGGLFVISQKEAEANAEANKLYTESPSVTSEEIFSNSGNNIYYFYKEDCSYCNEAKPELLKFKNANDEAKTDVTFNIVDMEAEANAGLWYSGEDYATDENYKSEPSDIKTLEDLQIIGTPAMIYVEDGVVKEYLVGNGEIYQFLNQKASELNLGVEIG